MFKPNTSHSVTSKINTRLSLLLMTLLMLPVAANATIVLLETPLGDIELEMLEEDAPNTVANFLAYVNGGNYENSFIHRSEPDFVLQGGGWTFVNDIGARQVAYGSTIDNEFKVSNTRGTVAMARLSGDADSATSQWFINLKDNSDPLDTTDGGYTVFARVISGMDVADAISELEIIDASGVGASGTFANLPVIDYTQGEDITTSNLVMTTLTELDRQFVMNAGLNDAWYEPETSGQGFFITVLPTRGQVIASWFTFDTEYPPADASGNLMGVGQRWMQAIGSFDGNTAVLTNYITTGGLFDEPSEVTNTEDGTITLTFEDCNTGTVEYDIPSIDRQGSIPIQRVADDNIELCETIFGVE